MTKHKIATSAFTRDTRNKPVVASLTMLITAVVICWASFPAASRELAISANNGGVSSIRANQKNVQSLENITESAIENGTKGTNSSASGLISQLKKRATPQNIGASSSGTGGEAAQNFVGATEDEDDVFPTLLQAVIAQQAAGSYPWPVWTPAIPVVAPSTTGNTYYVDGTAGADTNTGRTAALPFKTIRKALTSLAAGDTVLIKKGLYREAVNMALLNVPTGTAAKPVTIGSFGDGEVIIDGATKVTGWTLVGGTVWRAPITFTPIAIVVNDVPLKQVTQGQGGSTAPPVGLAGVTSGSGKWHNGGSVVTADMGTTIGSGNPNQADIVVPNNIGDQQVVYFYRQKFFRFVGLTVRGSGSSGIWGYGSNITVESCNIKFNGKSAVSFLPDTLATEQNADNAVLTSRAYHNVLLNWPRGNNGYAEAGGGWGGGLAWSGALRPIARGNIAHMNGGEGIISYGTYGKPSGSALFEQNVAYDNWSVNMYFDNQPNNTARNNLLYNHPIDYNLATTNFLYVSPTFFPYNSLGKFSVCLMLADEQSSSDSTNNYANLNNSKVYNNIMAGCRIGIRDYSEGAITQQNHGIKNSLIVNNTIILPKAIVPNAGTYGIFLTDNGTRNLNTTIANNIIYGYNNDALIYSEKTGPLTGISLNYNVYYSTGSTPFGSGNAAPRTYNLAGWKVNATGSDANSLFADPQLLNVNHFNVSGIEPYQFNNADIGANSPARSAGAVQNLNPALNYRLESRRTWNSGAF
jgi:hypothetical protein